MERQDVQPDGSHNVVTLRVASHVWSGIPVHDIRMKARQGRAWHPLNCEQPVLSVVVNEVRGQCEARLDLGVGNAFRPSGRQRSAGHVSLIPAGVPVWGYSDGIDQVDEVRLVLNVDRLKEIMGEEFTSAPLQEPRLVFHDESLQALARLIVFDEDTAEWSSLFGDSLVAAMVARLSNLDRPLPRNHRRLGLSTRQLSAVQELISRQSRETDSIVRIGEPGGTVAFAVRSSLQDVHRNDAPPMAFGCPHREREATAGESRHQLGRDRARYRLFRAKPLQPRVPSLHGDFARRMASRDGQLMRAPRRRFHSQR
jgi:hypothetical protein